MVTSVVVVIIIVVVAVAIVAPATAAGVPLILFVLPLQLIEAAIVEVNAALAMLARLVAAIPILCSDSRTVEWAWPANSLRPGGAGLKCDECEQQCSSQYGWNA